MFSKVLVANRGEIALRVIRACREMGIRTAITYSEIDRESLPVRMADEAICIGPGPSSKSYLNISSIVSAALICGADAVHPGCGFLSENSYLAEICEKVGITFVGPPSSVLEKMSDKASAREIARDAGVPVMPGSTSGVIALEEARRVAYEIGFPVVLKPVAGGGGRGLRVVQSETELVDTFPISKAEALAAFSNAELYVEKYLPGARHVEVQILADEHGSIVSFPERDCSIQRRHQKLVEESPAPTISDKTRQTLSKAALRVAKAAGYVNAGTMEFLVSGDGRVYFMETNSRIQVEHPITEMITGTDLVKWQLRLAARQQLGLKQSDIQPHGHAIECRICAEDGDRRFSPQSGVVDFFLPAGGPGVRVDSHLYPGYHSTTFYDSLLAKVIAWGEDRAEAVARMQRALSECIIGGVRTTIPFHQRVISHPAYRDGELCVDFVERYLESPVEERVASA
ncbi:MAG: acetyl-CoA carboxylase biotin carboxylase subunit [Chloroflexi bacterium]|nr:acetyl-CoA carboxylase biotin carboxylase subunit [Chloroflexota bacterium]